MLHTLTRQRNLFDGSSNYMILDFLILVFMQMAAVVTKNLYENYRNRIFLSILLAICLILENALVNARISQEEVVQWYKCCSHALIWTTSISLALFSWIYQFNDEVLMLLSCEQGTLWYVKFGSNIFSGYPFLMFLQSLEFLHGMLPILSYCKRSYAMR